MPRLPAAHREHLTRHHLLDAALVLLDDDPHEFSMRALASSLDVGVSSLYRHVSGRDDVINGAMELVWGRLRDEVDWTREPADELLVEIMLASVRLWSRHPRLGVHLGAPAVDTEASRAALKVMAEVFRQAGFSSDEIGNVSYALSSLTVGHIMLSSARHLAEERLAADEGAPPVLEAASIDDPDEAAIAAAMSTERDLTRFEQAARALLAGLRD